MKTNNILTNVLIVIMITAAAAAVLYFAFLITTIDVPSPAEAYQTNYKAWVKTCGKGNVSEDGVSAFGYQQFKCTTVPSK